MGTILFGLGGAGFILLKIVVLVIQVWVGTLIIGILFSGNTPSGCDKCFKDVAINMTSSYNCQVWSLNLSPCISFADSYQSVLV